MNNTEAACLAQLCEKLQQRNEELIEEVTRLRLQVHSTETNMDEGEEEYWSIKEAADALGLSTKALYDAWGARRLPGAVKIGGSIRIHRPTLLASSMTLNARGRYKRKGA